MWKLLRVPSGRTRGSKKHVSPPGACARTRNASHIGAEQNHFCPVSRCSPFVAVGTARVVLLRTSEPPCLSVIAIPKRTPRLVDAGRNPGSYSRVVISGSHFSARFFFRRSAG